MKSDDSATRGAWFALNILVKFDILVLTNLRFIFFFFFLNFLLPLVRSVLAAQSETLVPLNGRTGQLLMDGGTEGTRRTTL